MRSFPRFLAVLLAVLGFVFVPSTVSAHGSTESNLDGEVLEVAPERAEFVYSGDVDRSTARASLRYLGEQKLSAEDYFRFDVPTLELVPVEPLTGTGPEFAFALPRLAAGSYAVDWEVTPIGDHADSSVTFFQVTVGVSDPDPVPPVPAGTSDEAVIEGNEATASPLTDASAVGAPADDATTPQGWDRTRWLGLAGALVLIGLLTAFYVIRDRDE